MQAVPTMALLLPLLLLLLLLLPVACSTSVATAPQQSRGVPLSGWQLAGSDCGVRVSCEGAPSLVHIDLHKAGQIADPFDSTEIDDEDNRWVMTESNWTYTAHFDVESSEGPSAAPPQSLLLVAQGLDTLATIRHNGVVVGHSANMHLRVVVPLRAAQGANTLSFSFADPVPYAAEQQRLHPCGCSKDTAPGRTCPANRSKPCQCCNFATQFPIYSWAPGRVFVRKAQSHYGWNWGPATMPRGFFRSVSLLALAPALPVLEDVLVGVQPLVPLPLTAPLVDGATDFNVTLTLKLRSEVALPAGQALAICSEWGGAQQRALPALDAGTTTVRIMLDARNVRLWWPHELRPVDQPVSKLYSFNISITSPSAVDFADEDTHGEFSAVLTRRIGFRVAELVQDAPAVGDGTLFQWRINGVLLYIRGANVIPFDALTTVERVGLPQFKSVVGSAVAAHMQMLRVWGGGQYLASEFYDVCDEMGVLVWQEVAFACAIYPAHAEFAASVRAEIQHQTTRLSAHPSLVLWCGNNEAEQKWGVWNMDNAVWKQYYALAYDVIVQTLREQLGSVHSNVPIWPSSPSNGLQRSWSDPMDPTRGDIHKYVYFGDCTDPSLFGPTPRFQSEFGFPSYPQESELAARAAHPTDMAIDSRFNIARQDLNCPLSNSTRSGWTGRPACAIPMLIELLPLPPGGWAQQSLAVWRHSLYAGQVAQALCIEAQAAHLRRGRDTAAQTGGSLFWQINSEWPGGSKSSLEYDGGWKVLMHRAQRFYAPFAASAFLTDRYGNFSVHLANDRTRPLHASWQLEVWRYNETAPLRPAWCPLHPGGCALTLAPGSGHTVLDNVRHNSLTHVHANASQGIFLRVVAWTADGDVSSTFTPLGGRGLAGAEGLAADARVTLTVHANRSVTLLSDRVVPHAWLRLRPPAAPLPGAATSAERFSQNALLLLPHQPITVDLLPVPGGEMPTITTHEMQQRLTVDCFNRLGGCNVDEAAHQVLKTDDVPTELPWLHSQLSAASFGPATPFTLPFWSTQPLGTHIKPPTSTLASEYNSALMCGANLSRGSCMFAHDDEWVGRVLPMWRKVQDAAYASEKLTLPFMRNVSAVRMLGGFTSYSSHITHNSSFEELPHWDLCYRDANGALVHNWTRMDTTLDAFVANGITPSPIVLDDTPYAFVKPENRFFAAEDSPRHTHFFGHGAAPDNATEFGEFIEAMVRHLVARYGHPEVSRWSFRLGTECQNSRMGPPWVGDDGNGVVALPTADGTLKNFSHGLDQYITTYLAVSSAVKRVVPDAKIGPCNIVCAYGLYEAGVQQGPHTSGGAEDHSPISAAGYAQVNDLFGSRLYAARAPVDFIAMTEYSHAANQREPDGHRDVAPQAAKAGIERITEIGMLATTGKKTGSKLAIPVEVHEYGWAGWGGYRGGFRWPHGSFGAAYNVASWLWMRQGGVARVFTWGYKFDDSLAVANPEASGATAAHVGRPLISGWGWTLGAMEILLGTDGDTIGAEMVVDTPNPEDPSYNYTFGSFRMAQPKARTLHYLLTAFSGSYTDHDAMDITLRITVADFPETSGGKTPFWDLANRSAVVITERVFNRTTCAHDQIRADLDAAGGYDKGLVHEDLPIVDAVNEMGTPAGLELAAKSTKKYLAMSDVSLLPRPFSGEVAVDGSSLVVSLRGVERPSLVLLSFAAAD